jgi:hypothetical protein
MGVILADPTDSAQRGANVNAMEMPRSWTERAREHIATLSPKAKRAEK